MKDVSDTYSRLNFVLGIETFRKSPLLYNFLDLHRMLYSDLGQDFFAYVVSNYSNNGFFVEIGAANGIHSSNSLFLEKLGWTGLLVEPGKNWQTSLKANRKSSISQFVVADRSQKKVLFYEAEAGNLSTFNEYINFDGGLKNRRKRKIYEVQTLSLQDLLNQYKCPSQINFLSIDTEGSEFEIIQDFDFSGYKIDFVCIEHNYNINREKISEKMEKSGFREIFYGQTNFDSWFVNNGVLSSFEEKLGI